MSNILQLVLVLLFDSYKPFFIAMRCLYILGAWMLLKKSGLPAFWSLVPWVREYQLGRSAGREPEGRSFCVTSMLITVLQLANICFRWSYPESYYSCCIDDIEVISIGTFNPGLLLLNSLVSLSWTALPKDCARSRPRPLLVLIENPG